MQNLESNQRDPATEEEALINQKFLNTVRFHFRAFIKLTGEFVAFFVAEGAREFLFAAGFLYDIR